MSKRSAEARLSELRGAFLEADENRDGALDTQEFKHFGLQMFKKPCPLAVYKGMCDYCGKTVEQGLSWEDIKKLFLDSNIRRRRDPSRPSSQDPPYYNWGPRSSRQDSSRQIERDLSPRPSQQRYAGYAHSRTQSSSSASTFRRDSYNTESSSYHVRNPALGYIDERDSTYSLSNSFDYFDRIRPRHYTSKSLNNVYDFYDDHNSSQIQNELVKILRHKFNKAQSRLTKLDKKGSQLELRRLKETDERREAEQTLRKLQKELKDLVDLTCVRNREAGGSESARPYDPRQDLDNGVQSSPQEVTAGDVGKVEQKLQEFQIEHQNLMLDLSRKQDHIPILKKEIDLLDNENALLRQLCENLGIVEI